MKLPPSSCMSIQKLLVSKLFFFKYRTLATRRTNNLKKNVYCTSLERIFPTWCCTHLSVADLLMWIAIGQGERWRGSFPRLSFHSFWFVSAWNCETTTRPCCCSWDFLQPLEASLVTNWKSGLFSVIGVRVTVAIGSHCYLPSSDRPTHFIL